MTAAKLSSIQQQIEKALNRYARISPARTKGLLPTKSLQGKLYEASVLAEVCKQLHTQEGFTIRLSEGTRLMFRQKGGAITDEFPFLEIIHHGAVIAELHTDIYFTTLSNAHKAGKGPSSPGDYHELDIALIKPGIKNGYPSFKDVFIAIECKNKVINKGTIREILGFRRELSTLQELNPTGFNKWPMNEVPSFPPSVQMFYCSDRYIKKFEPNCKIFGIQLEWYQM